MADIRRISRPYAYLVALFVAYLLPLGFPNVGVDEVYFFIFIIVFFAWLVIRWNAFEAIQDKSAFWEVILGVGIVGAVYAEKIALATRLGLLDMVVIFVALAIAFFGVRSLKMFWVPAAYGVVLLLGYQVENDIPNYVALQDWMAGIMASAMNALGIAATTSGHIVALNSSSGSPLLLDVESDCTGIQGVLAFGLLGSMALLDVKAKWSRLIPFLAIGFIGVFLINILRLLLVFLTFEFLGASLGNDVHVYAGYTLFVAWILIFWSLAYRYMMPRPAAVVSPVVPPATGPTK
jgi:exosortase/archaeosortase family protein